MRKFILDVRKDPTKDDSASPKCELLTTDVFYDKVFRELEPMVIEVVGDKHPAEEFKKLLRDPDAYDAICHIALTEGFLEACAKGSGMPFKNV